MFSKYVSPCGQMTNAKNQNSNLQFWKYKLLLPKLRKAGM